MNNVLTGSFLNHVDLAQCPKCQNIAANNLRVVFEHKWEEEGYPASGTTRHAFCVCTECSEAWYRVHTKYYDEPRDSVETTVRTYPPHYGCNVEREAEQEVWYAVRALRDATACYNMGMFDPCVLLCRRAVELYLHGVFPGTGALATTIDTALAQGRITAHQREFFQFLRETGNVAAHATKYVYGADEAKVILDATSEAINTHYRHRRIRESIKGH